MNHKSVLSSFLVPSKPQHRRESGSWSFDTLESLHLNLLGKEVLFLFPAPYAALVIIQHHSCVETSSWLSHPSTSFAQSFVKHPRWTKTVTLESNTAWQRKAVTEEKITGLSETNSINYCVCNITLYVSVLEVIHYILYRSICIPYRSQGFYNVFDLWHFCIIFWLSYLFNLLTFTLN